MVGQITTGERERRKKKGKKIDIPTNFSAVVTPMASPPFGERPSLGTTQPSPTQATGL